MTEARSTTADAAPVKADWPLYEVFVRGKRGLNHVHVGSLHAPDDEMALHHARNVYTRRNEGVSIWSSPRPRSSPRARQRRTRSSPPAATRCIATPPSTTFPTTSPTCEVPTMIDHDNAYGELIGEDDHGQWAFGTSFDDPLVGVDTTVPEDVDRSALARYCLMLGDDALISSHRLSEWCAHAPELEEEMALANIGLDLLGQARLLLARARGRRSDSCPLHLRDLTGPGRGRPGLLPYRVTATLRSPVRARQRRLRSHHPPRPGLRDLAAGGVRTVA